MNTKRTLVRYRNSKFGDFVVRHKKYAPVLFFIGGFVFDTLTLGRIDRTYDIVMLCIHMTSLSITLYLFNLMDDGKWDNTFLARYQVYFPLAIQFFFGGLSSAYVIYFFRSVSLSKTMGFFILLLLLLLANEFLKKRISNKYLQFGVYFFISFIFFAFMIPVFIKEMNSTIFMISGLVSLGSTLALIIFIYGRSKSTRKEVSLKKLIGLVLLIYITINVFYYFKLIPPVPLAMDTGLVAHKINKQDGKYLVTYETENWYVFWRKHKLKFIRSENEPVYVFSSIFAPTDLNKKIYHRWEWFNPKTETWEIVEDIGYNVIGGRDNGFRGYTYKNNVKNGLWKVEVITEEELVIGVIDFEIIKSDEVEIGRLAEKSF